MVTKNLKLKRILMTIIIIFLVFSIINLSITKIIYDLAFPRYDCAQTHYPEQLNEIINQRKEQRFSSGKNTLCGYLYKSGANTKKDTLIILASGHNSCSDNYLWQIKELLDFGWSVFAFDSTGCCNSQGKSAVGFSQELLDLKAALNYIEGQNRFDFNNLALLGHSRGGYAACCALSYGYDISAVISVSGINSAMEGIICSASEYVGKLSYLNYGFLWLYQSFLFGSKTTNLRANEILSKTETPVLVIHGAEDATVPTDKFSVYSYKNSFSSDSVKYILRSAPDNSAHTNLLFDNDSTANDELIKEINNFLENTQK